MTIQQIENEIKEILKYEFGIDQKITNQHLNISLFQVPFEFSPIDLVKLYYLVKKRYALIFSEDDFNNYNFINIKSITQLVHRKLSEKNEKYSRGEKCS